MRKYGLLLLGSVIMALALDLFLVPAKIAPGGVSGLATVLGYFTDMSVGLMIFLINIPIFIWGFFEFDRKFLFSSMVGTLALSSFTGILAFFVVPITDNEILQTVFGGALLGLGFAVVLMSGATTGGTEIVAKILKKKFPYFSIGIFILIIDALVVILTTVLTRRWETMLYSGLALYISTKVIDGILDGVNYAKMTLIVTDFPSEISLAVSQKMGRGTTTLFGYSDYTKQDKKVVMCVTRKTEIFKLKEIVKETDRDSFVIVADVREVQGKGFG